MRLEVPLSAEERESYERDRGAYLDFLRAQRDPHGRARRLGPLPHALVAERRRPPRVRRVPPAARARARRARQARGARAPRSTSTAATATIVFTEDNATVYAISRRFLLPAITHQTKVKERSRILAAFNAGELTAVVTSKVLNEGVNVPEANVAIVLSGLRLGARARAAPRPHPPQGREQAGHPLRARRRRHGRGAHQREAAGARCLPLISSARGGRRARSCPAYLRGAAAARLLPVARYYAETHAGLVGETRDDVDAVLATLEVPARDRVAALGLRKVIEDRCEFEVAPGADPEELRHDVFWAAARAHRALDVRAELRPRARCSPGRPSGAAPRSEAIEAGLYADLRGSEILKRVEPLSPEAAIERYNLGLAQAILLRAVRVVVRVEGGEVGDAARYRRLFRAARFHQLIHVVEGSADGGLHHHARRPLQPLRLGAALRPPPRPLPPQRPRLPAPSTCAPRCSGARRGRPRSSRSSPATGSSPTPAGSRRTSPEIEAFRAAFTRLESEWSVERSERVFALPGEVVCVPDLVFENRRDGGGGLPRGLRLLEPRGRVAARRAARASAPSLRASCSRWASTSASARRCWEKRTRGRSTSYKAAMSPRAVLERLRVKR